MKKFTLVTLAVLFVAVSSVAQSMVSGRPLSQKHLEAATQLAGKNMKQQPSKQSLHMQQGLEQQKALRTATAVHNKLTGKTVAPAKKQHKAPRRAASDIIYDQPEGKQVMYSRSGSAYYVFWGYVFNTTLKDAVGDVVFGNDGKVYIKDLVSQAGVGTWVVGTLSGSTITIQLPQTAYYVDDYGYGLEVSKIVYDANQGWYVKAADQTLTLNYDAATGKISSKGSDIVGLTYDDDDSWSGYADWNLSFEKITDELVEAPAELTTEQYALTADGYAGSLVQVGFSGNDVYVQGIDPNLPDTWVKGTISGTTVTFKSGQYVGADLVSGYHQYLVSATSEQVYDDYYEEYYTEYSLSDGDITFKYDAATKTLSEGSTFLLNGGKTSVNYLSAFDNAKLAPFTEVAATPAAPTDLYLYEGGWTYFSYGYGWGYLDFNLNTSDVDGNYILPEKLSYQLYVKVNGEVKPLNLSWWDYMNQEEETMSEIPYGYSDNWDIGASGAEQYVYYYVIGPEAYGVQAIYRGAGEERRSEIAWADVYELGAEVQPAAATPAYPDATIASTDNRIDYGYYTGSEDINTATNNSKPETYDVAIKLSDPALAGTLIESITFPVQSLEGVSNLSVFLTSQLRVEDGKNAADLVVKTVTPAKAGFVTVTLDKPYTIPEGGVYVGYSMTVDDVTSDETAEPITITDQTNAGGFYLHTSDGFLKWLDVAEAFGGSAMIQVKLAGSAVKANAASVADSEVIYTMTGEKTTVPVTVTNHGSNGIQSMDVLYSINEQNGSKHVEAAVDGFFGKTTTIDLDIPAMAEKGNYELVVTVEKVNGSANEDAVNSTTIPVIALNTVPKKRTLLEEYTGFWCGYCPRGYVGLEKLAELYPNEYVLVSYHNGDELEITENFPSPVAGFPDAWMDRAVEVDAYYGLDYGAKDFGIADDLAARNQQFGQADITFSSQLSDDQSKVDINAEVVFPYDLTDGNYTVEYILTADGLTDPSWGQSNYYANANYGTPLYMDTFTQTSDSYVYDLVYNDVAILTSELLGGSGSSVTTATADEPVQLQYSFSLADAINTSYQNIIQDVTKLKVVALLINNATGEVLNANCAKVGETTGISIVEAVKNNTVVARYSLDGRRVSETQKGIVIEKMADGRAVKVVK